MWLRCGSFFLAVSVFAGIRVANLPHDFREAQQVSAIRTDGDEGVWPLSSTRSVKYHTKIGLPRSARQGSRNWYLVHLHLKLTFTNEASGLVQVAWAVNGANAAQLEFAHQGDKYSFQSSSAIGPPSTIVDHHAAREISFDNYLPERALGQASSFGDFTVHTSGRAIARLEMFPDSRVYRSHFGPAAIQLVMRLGKPNRKAEFLIRVLEHRTIGPVTVHCAVLDGAGKQLGVSVDSIVVAESDSAWHPCTGLPVAESGSTLIARAVSRFNSVSVSADVP